MDGSFHVTLAAGKRWIAGGLKGSVVSNLVTWVWTGSAFVVPSAMAKTALHAMTMSLAVEWGRYGIRLNATAPGPFPDRGRLGEAEPDPRRDVLRDARRHRPARPLRTDPGTAEPHHLPAFRRLRLSDRANHRDRRRAASGGPFDLRGPDLADGRAMARRARSDPARLAARQGAARDRRLSDAKETRR